MQDATDYQDTINYLSDFAEGLESEAMTNPSNTERLASAAMWLQQAIAALRPLAETDN